MEKKALEIDLMSSSPVKEEIFNDHNIAILKVGSKRPYQEGDDMKPLITNQNDVNSINQDEKVEYAKAKICEVKEENERLKMHLSRVMKDYESLKVSFNEIVHNQNVVKKSCTKNDKHKEINESDNLVSLCLGRHVVPSSDSKRNESIATFNPKKMEDIEQDKEKGLSLGLHYKLDVSKSDENETFLGGKPSLEKSCSRDEKEKNEEAWEASKLIKKTRSGDNEVLEHNHIKKARVSVRARCDTPTMNDGCQWRKYGQKIAKGNPCPRAYYRCTVAPSCPVRKQVQRCANDMSVLISTYEGTHNHPLSMSATTMASTTSAAAAMLLSDSSSTSNSFATRNATTKIPKNLQGLNFYFSDNSKSKNCYLPTNTSFLSSTSCPTITLDLTTSTLPSSFSSSFNQILSTTSTYPHATKYPFTNLSFSTYPSDQYNSSNSVNTFSWGSNGKLFSYENVTTPFPFVSTTQFGSSISTSTFNINERTKLLENHPNIIQSFTQKSPLQQSLPVETIAAATKMISTDPSFQSALASALTTIIEKGTTSSFENGTAFDGGKNNWGQKLKWLQKTCNDNNQSFLVASTEGYKSSSNISIKGDTGCGSSYMNNATSTTSSEQESLMFLPPVLETSPFSSSKSTSDSPLDS